MNRVKRCIQIATPLLLCAGVALAASDPFSSGADTVSSDMKHICQVIGVGLLGIGGIGMKMDHNHGVAGKMSAMGIGSVFAFLPEKIAGFIQSF